MLALFINGILIMCVICSVVSAFQNARKVSFVQNIENVRTLTDASANKVELEILHHTEQIKDCANYVNHYQGTGMTVEEMQNYFSTYYSEKDSENVSWQLVNATINEEIGAKKGFDAISLGDEKISSFSYKTQEYPELAKIFCNPDKKTLGMVQYTSEFTEASPRAMKSFALVTPIRFSDGQYKTLMLLIDSNYMNGLISNNNEIDTLNFFDFSNIIIDNNGNYVISNRFFQGKNFLDYIELYNPTFDDEMKETIWKGLHKENYSDVFYYENNKGQKCAYTIVPVQNSDWHMLSIVPLQSFHNSHGYNMNFVIFALFFTLLFLVDMLYVMRINMQLRYKTKEAQEANYAKSEFLSSMSHDIRTPMNAILGMTIIADENLKKEKPDWDLIKECINTMKLSGKHLLTLINDVLDISKIENGKIVLSSEEFSIKENMKKLLEVVQAEAQSKNLHLELQMEQIDHEYICADGLRMNQIYLNIISNAIKYTNPGGNITVTMREETVQGTQSKARYIYQVTDTGIGMEPEFLKTIFDRFSRAVDTRVNTTQGTGLGMTICKQLVDLMGGTITVESELNVGSTFTVMLELPIAQEQNIQNTNKAESGITEDASVKEEYVKDTATFEDRPVFNLRVLVVEDNEINWKVLARLLKMYGIDADRAENGLVGVNKVKDSACTYDVIFMDVQMPVMNGYDATCAIRKLSEPEKASIPVYAMTADTFAEDVLKCREKGMNGHLAKPIEIEKLQKILMEVSKK